MALVAPRPRCGVRASGSAGAARDHLIGVVAASATRHSVCRQRRQTGGVSDISALDLMTAVRNNDVQLFEVARAGGYIFGATEVMPFRSLLSWAAEWGRAEIVEMMLNAGVDREPLALAVAAHKGHLSTVRLLLAHGFDPNLPADFPPLCAAADRCSVDCVRALLDAGADPTLATGPDHGRWSNRTALQLAEMRDQKLCVAVVSFLRLHRP